MTGGEGSLGGEDVSTTVESSEVEDNSAWLGSLGESIVGCSTRQVSGERGERVLVVEVMLFWVWLLSLG